MSRPRLPDNIAKRDIITIKATNDEFKAWKTAVAVFGAKGCLKIALDALEKAVIEHIDTLVQIPDSKHDKCD